MKLLALGYGYSAKYLAKRLLTEGWQVVGTSRTPQSTQEKGLEIIAWDEVNTLDLQDFTHILVSIAPTADGDPTLHMLGAKIAAAKHLQWLGYLSTTGVYGNHDGAWVNEETPPAPTSQRGQWRVAAENAWLDLYEEHDIPVHIFRLAGIYGPGRGPFEKIRKGTARCIIKENQVFSRIHVEDIAEVLRASIRNPHPGRLYNVCDDMPAPPQDVLTYAASLLDMPSPPRVPFESADMSPMARSFYQDSKKVFNLRIKNELDINLKYPNYMSGLGATLNEDFEKMSYK